MLLLVRGEWLVTGFLDSEMASDVDRAYCEWPNDELADGEDSQEESVSGILDHGSISFGRYEAESLSWEKWSVFSHNRCQEELEKFKAPGLVAQKKAYFEEYYRKLRALKNLQQDQQDAHGLESLDSPDHPNGTKCHVNGEVDCHEDINVQNCEPNDNRSTCPHEEPESFFNHMLNQRDECLKNSEVVDGTFDVVEIHLADPDLDESRSCIIDDIAIEDSKLSSTVEDTLKDQEEISFITVEPAVIAQSDIARPKSESNTCKNTKRDEDHKKLNKIELNIKRYKEKTALLKTSVSGGNTRNVGALHKNAAAKIMGRQKLEPKSKLPGIVLKEPIQRDKGAHSVNKRITVTSRASKSASAHALLTITRYPSSFASKQMGAAATKVKSSSSMNSIVKPSGKVTKIAAHRKEALTSHTPKTSSVISVKSTIQKPATDTKRTLEDRSQKPRTTYSNINEVKRTSAVCRPRAISQLKESEKNKILRKEEKRKPDSTASKSDKRFTALPLPRFHKNAPSTQMREEVSSNRPAKSVPGGEKPRQSVWR